MIRHASIAGVLALLAACGPVAEESDEPGATPTPPPSDSAPPPEMSGGEVGQRPAAFAQCAVCHKVEPGQTGIGPSLAGVYGAEAGHVEDFAYSQAMRRSGLAWEEATLDRFLEAPLRTVPGTKMAYPGLKDPAQRQAVIAYLKTL